MLFMKDISQDFGFFFSACGWLAGYFSTICGRHYLLSHCITFTPYLQILKGDAVKVTHAK